VWGRERQDTTAAALRPANAEPCAATKLGADGPRKEKHLSRHGDPRAVSLGQGTTVFAVLEAHPFLEQFLLAYHAAFCRISRPGARTSWARITTLGDVAIEMDVT